MEEAVAEELKVGELMRKDVLQELEVIQSLSSKLLVFDLKRKHIESHFDSLVELIERKKDEAVEVIRSREEEARKREEEFRLREERLEQRAKQVEGQLKAEIEKLRKEVERRAEECELKEKELSKAKIVIERLCAELSEKEKEKEKEISGMKKAVDDLTMRIKEEDERRNAACQKLSDENLALQEEVKSLTQQLEVKKQLPEREELLPAIQKFLHIFASAGIIKICNPIKYSELNGEDLFILVRDHVHDQETDTSKVSSLLLETKDKAPDLVLEALRISYLSESEEQNSQSMFGSCRILLLEQLGQICPQGISQARKEALKVAVEWSAQVKSCANKSFELSRFLQFLSMYGIASGFGDEVLVPMLYCVAVNEGTPDFCFTLGFANRITRYIKTMIANDMAQKALEYVCAFKLTREFSVARIVNGHLKRMKKNSQNMRKEGGVDNVAVKMQVLDFQIDTLEKLITGVKDLELQSICTSYHLEEKLANLKRQKISKKRPAPFSEPNDNPEPLKKKGCKLPGNAKSTKVFPNTYPKTGSKNVFRSNPSSDHVPSRKKGWNTSGTTKSTEVIAKPSTANSEIGSRDALCFDAISDPAPSMEKVCSVPETAKLKESPPQCTSNTCPVTGSRDALHRPDPNSYPESLKEIGCKLLGTANSREDVSISTSNVHPEIGSSDALHRQEMQRAPFHFNPLQFRYKVPADSPYIITTSPKMSWYPPLPPPPPQYYHPSPPV
ncbi:unnamed protein product [Rhodiola kirilowii]